MNMHAWLQRHPIASVLTPELVVEESKHQYGDEFRTQLEQWESEITAVVWHMIKRRRSHEEIRRYVLTSGHQAIQNVSVARAMPMLGSPRAIALSFTYRGLHHRCQVFHIPT